MEPILRKIVESLVLMFAYVPLGTATIAFVSSITITTKQSIAWAKHGKWAIPRLFETVNTDIFSLLLDEKVTGYRNVLIEFAAKLAIMPAPLFLLISGCICLCIGLVMQQFARAIKQAGAK